MALGFKAQKATTIVPESIPKENSTGDLPKTTSPIQKAIGVNKDWLKRKRPYLLVPQPLSRLVPKK